MRLRCLPPPSPGELSRLQLHELARDFPELWELFRAWSVDWRVQGTETLEVFLRGDESRGQAIRRALAWRESAGTVRSLPDLGVRGGEVGPGSRSRGGDA